MRLLSPNPQRTQARPGRVGPPSSAAHSAPPAPHDLHRVGPKVARQPTCQGAALSSAHEQKKTAQIGRAALGLERISVSATIVFDDLQSDTLRSLARARFGACQQLLTEGDYRHFRAECQGILSRIFDGFTNSISCVDSGVSRSAARRTKSILCTEPDSFSHFLTERRKAHALVARTPVIGITSALISEEQDYGTMHRHRVSADYSEAVLEAGGLPIILPPQDGTIDRILESGRWVDL